jgi:hypothetical protein
MRPAGLRGAVETLKRLAEDPGHAQTFETLTKELKELGGTEHALEGQVSRLKRQMRGEGGRFATLADHWYRKRELLGLWPQPKPQRRTSPG